MATRPSAEPTSNRVIAPGIEPKGHVHWNLEPRALYDAAARRNEGHIFSEGPFVAITMPHTGRSPKDTAGVILASVVPPVNATLAQMSERYFGIKAVFVGDKKTHATKKVVNKIRKKKFA